MDKVVEDKMVKQIEKNLSNNLNDSLFQTGKLYDKDPELRKLPAVRAAGDMPQTSDSVQEQPIVSFDYSNPISISRAEYIRQARESCLRQLSSLQSTARAYDSYYLDTAVQTMEPAETGKPGHTGLFGDNQGGKAEYDAETPQETAAFRMLVTRIVCAMVIFLGVFLIDKFNLKMGPVSSDSIEEYVTGKDTFEEWENKLVAWLKDER